MDVLGLLQVPGRLQELAEALAGHQQLAAVGGRDSSSSLARS